MKQLSPKKYIETKVRLLPVYKCLVNKDWREAGLANVIVMRRHVNGNVSGGIYLVDLKCLGVKDSFWFFNESEEDMIERFGGQNMPLKTVDYALAHNIVYAGHDFAMEFDIQPNKEFATSRFVLEDDTDDIPLIDIETGENGIPHLIVNEAGQYTEALAKLRKNAGEGNYHYTVMSGSNSSLDEDDNFEEDEDDMDEDITIPQLHLLEIAGGELDLMNVRDVRIENLTDEDLVTSRSEVEQWLCKAELTIRAFNLLPIADEGDEMGLIEDEWSMFPETVIYGTGIDENSYVTAMEQIAEAIDEITKTEADKSENDIIREKYLKQHKDNPLFVCLLFEFELMRKEKGLFLLQPYIQLHRKIPSVQLLLALESLLKDENKEEWEQIINACCAIDALPQLQVWSETELLYFWVIQIIRHVKEGKLPEAVAYYELFATVNDALLHLPVIMIIYNILLPPLEAAILADVNRTEQADEENNYN